MTKNTATLVLSALFASMIAMPVFADNEHEKLVVSDLEVREENGVGSNGAVQTQDDFLIMEASDMEQIRVFGDNGRVD